MRKFVLFTIGFFFFSSFLYADLTKAQLWAISLPGILTEARDGYRNSLNDKAMNESGRNSVFATLRNDWGITNREELFDTLDSLEDGGHHGAFKEIKSIVNAVIRAGTKEAAIRRILDGVLWDQAKWNRFVYVYNNWEKFNGVTLLGWDLGRSVALCRWAYNVGFMTESEAWKRIFYIARIVQQNFNSWEEYGFDYFMGRLFWASSNGEEETYLERTEPIYNRLLNSYWSWLEWDIDLDAEEDAVPIITRHFLPPDDNNGTVQYLTNDPAALNRYSWDATTMPINADGTIIYEMRVNKISGNDNFGFGMVFCADSGTDSVISPIGDFYRFFINVNGIFSIQKFINGSSVTAPVDWRYSSLLNTGYGVFNTLRVERNDYERGTTFRVFINGSHAATFNDFSPLTGQYFGPFVVINSMVREQFPHIPVDVRFDY